ncbi:MAG: multifunctional oxoglutarate decarboxylase/oxoglutarate dehydrogenase thiamine pyrophosphate-binding subunit/dihydrolipoyllysine-residue succinyltransferase subunit, partial [bacterium]|nr:multifunctional oxoglutarate decarboxylase/oxoglutarate dehydrogenase thiamine pyrophosphate-binding subunit/dihydrolipoyllysine-residue succinyltransferase subunit [bacterium]
MADWTKHRPNINNWVEDELYQQYVHDQQAVDDGWKEVFEANGSRGAPAPPATPAPPVDPTDQLVPLRGAAARIADNMNASLTVPVATSQRTMPVKVMEENRRVINQHRTLLGHSKISFTHLIAFALVKALEEFPSLNHAFVANADGQFRLVRRHVNLGLAIDVAAKDGSRSLLVP